MCALLPVWLVLAIAPWPLGAPPLLAAGWDAVLLLAAVALVLRMRRPVEQVAGIPAARLPGLPCPACGSTETEAWMQGRVPVGLRCRACGRRSGAGDLAPR